MEKKHISLPPFKKKIKSVEITNRQLEAICEAADTLSGMRGVGSDFDPMAKRIVSRIDAFLKRNGYKRIFK